MHKVHTPIGGRKDGRTDGRTDGQTDGRNDGKPKTMSLRFSSKRRGTKRNKHINDDRQSKNCKQVALKIRDKIVKWSTFTL